MESADLDHLLDETQLLLAKLRAHRVPALQGLRDKLEASMASVKDALKKNRDDDRERDSERMKIRDVAASFNDYVTNYPWVALATGILIASTIGILATKATKRSLNH